MDPKLDSHIPLELPKTRRNPGYNKNQRYTNETISNTSSANFASKIPLKSRQVSTPIDIIDDKAYGTAKKSSIPRITSSPLYAGITERKSSTPVIYKEDTVTTPTSAKQYTKTPPSTITKLTSQLSSLTLESPSKHKSKLKNNPLKDSPWSKSSFATRSAVSSPMNDNKFNSIKSSPAHNDDSTPSPQQLGNRTSLLLKKRLQASQSPIKNTSPVKYSSFEPRSLKSPSTRSTSLGSTTEKRRSASNVNMSPLKENVRLDSQALKDETPLIARLTRSTAASDLKSSISSNNAKIPRSSTVSNLNQAPRPPKIRSVSNNPKYGVNSYSRYPSISNAQQQTQKLPVTIKKIPVSPAGSVGAENKENSSLYNRQPPQLEQKIFIRKRQDGPRPIQNQNFAKSFSVNGDLNQMLKGDNPKTQIRAPPQVSKRIISARRPQLQHPQNQQQQLRGRVSTINELTDCLLQFEKTKKMLQPENHTALLQNKKTSMIDFNSLTSYEKAELSKIDKVYYVSPHKISRSRLPISQSKRDFKRNFGFDDTDKNLILNIGDHINYRYQILAFLGKGSFGNVMRCFDHQTGKELSIKIMKNDLEWSLQCINEIKVLKKLIPNENCLTYFGHFNFRSHICIATELLGVNLYDALEATNFRPFELGIIKKWSRDLLSGLNFLHQSGIVHADLKPENIMLVSPNSLNIKIIDFGTSCPIGEISYPYIQSRFYRAPEIVLGCRYNEKIDIWSFSVMIFELYMGNPMFAAKDEHHLLSLIIETLGTPSPGLILEFRDELNTFGSVIKRKDIKHIDIKATIFTRFDQNGNFVGPKVEGARSPIRSPNVTNSLLFNDFLLNSLVWDYKERASAYELLNHEFLS